MDRYCPECNSNMTPSLVGYLCVNCGHVQRFYSAKGATMSAPVAPALIHSSATTPDEHERNHHHKSTQKHAKPKNKVKTTLKRLMVPELAPPHAHLIGDGDDSITPVLADKIDPIAASKANAGLAEKSINNEQSANSPSQSPVTEAVHPNQSSNLSELESALHPQKNTSIWVMLALAALMLIVAAAVLFLIILS